MSLRNEQSFSGREGGVHGRAGTGTGVVLLRGFVIIVVGGLEAVISGVEIGGQASARGISKDHVVLNCLSFSYQFSLSSAVAALNSAEQRSV